MLSFPRRRKPVRDVAVHVAPQQITGRSSREELVGTPLRGAKRAESELRSVVRRSPQQAEPHRCPVRLSKSQVVLLGQRLGGYVRIYSPPCTAAQSRPHRSEACQARPSPSATQQVTGRSSREALGGNAAIRSAAGRCDSPPSGAYQGEPCRPMAAQAIVERCRAQHSSFSREAFGWEQASAELPKPNHIAASLRPAAHGKSGRGSASRRKSQVALRERSPL